MQHSLELHVLVIACARSGFPPLEIRPETKEKLAGMNDPLARFLKSLVDGGLPEIPPDLPIDVRHMIEDLLSTIEEAQPGEPEAASAPEEDDA
jgi:hypothetical protein